MKKLLLICCLGLASLSATASQSELNNILVRVINQINTTLPLLDEAKNEIEPNSRIQLHIESFEGEDGKQHPGVRGDLLTIRNALIDYINKPAIEPKTIKPLEFDFIEK